MSDRVGIMHAGELVQVDTPRAVYERPASRFVADFVGASNVVPAQVVSVESAGQYTVSIPGSRGTSGGTRVVSVAGSVGLEVGTVGIVLRPEAATLSLPGADSVDAADSGEDGAVSHGTGLDGTGLDGIGLDGIGLDGIVEDVSFRGPQTSVQVRCSTAGIVPVRAGDTAAAGDTAGAGDTVEVTVVSPSQNIPPGLEPGAAVRVGFRGRDLWAIRP